MIPPLVVKTLKDGRACIHWFKHDPKGPIQTSADVAISSLGPIKIGGATGKIVCHPEQNTVSSQWDGNELRMCLNSDDVRAVTCPACIETDEYKEQSKALDEIINKKA